MTELTQEPITVTHARRRRVLLVGGALTPDLAAAYSIASVAAAKWQLSFARALATEWNAEVTCVSYVPVARGEPAERAAVVDGHVRILLVPREVGPLGSPRYAARILKELVAAKDRYHSVICYNPLVWTAPWAWLVAKFHSTSVLLVVADLEPSGVGTLRQRLRARVERALLRLGDAFLLLSPATAATLPRQTPYVVFNGVADEEALQSKQPEYEGIPRFVYAGSLTLDAGIDTFLLAAEIVAQAAVACEFHVFGKGTIPVPIPATLIGRLHVHGFVPDKTLNDFLGRDCVGVNPRRMRGAINEHNAPYKLLFYLSRGIVTLTTDTAGVPEELARCCIGCEDTAESVAAAMLKVIALSPRERSKMAAQGRAVVRETRSAKALSRLVEGVIHACSPRGGVVTQ